MPPDSPRRRDRLDRILVQRGLVETRAKAQALILAGRVSSGAVRLDKPGHVFALDVPLEVAAGRRYVGRGAYKLAGALDRFGIDPADRDALDVGASTGGFTQLLLERGAARVVALDVGRGQLDWTLRNDPRVVVKEGINARYLAPNDLPYSPQLAVVDVSFISLELVLPAVAPCMSTEGTILSLVKPQFELERGDVGRGGIVRDAELQERAVRRICLFAGRSGWGVEGVALSVLAGADGNREFFVQIAPQRSGVGSATVDQLIDAAVRETEALP